MQKAWFLCPRAFIRAGASSFMVTKNKHQVQGMGRFLRLNDRTAFPKASETAGLARGN